MTIALVHGNPETASIWGPLINALAAEGISEITTLSPPGFGAPTPDGWNPTPASYVDWLSDEVSKLEGPVDILGHDWGAGHVFGLLASAPHLVRSWACDCVGLVHPDYQWHDMAQVWQTEGAGEEAVASMRELPTADRQAMFEGLGMTTEIALDLAKASGDPEMGRCVLGLYRAAAQPALAQIGEQLIEADLPTGLVVDAKEDAYVGSELAPQMVAALSANHLQLEGQGHWWMISAPEVAAKGLAEFWKSLD